MQISRADSEKARSQSPYVASEQGDASEEEGSGLGLALVKSMVELLHGSFEVQSSLGAGSTITVRLPLSAPEAQNMTISGVGAEPAKGMEYGAVCKTA